jgi:putative Mg2+ transporter-C (MgtC) family protein
MDFDFPLIDWDLVIRNFLVLAAAYVLALPVAWDREKSARSAGLRTFPLVALASCGYILIADRVFATSPDGQARILQGLITGIGFIGGGAILKDGGSVRGTATAASIWTTGAIGAAVAYGRLEIAIVLCVINFATVHWLTALKDTIQDGDGKS